MKITILTLFPEMFSGILTNSIIKRAISKKIVKIKIVNIRDYTKDKYRRVDSAPVGGGAGLIMKCQPIVDAINANKSKNSHTILFSPKGKTYNQAKAHQLAEQYKDIILICGHYEGIDERVNNYVDELISVGDYVLTGGEIPAMCVVDSLTRLLKGAIAEESPKDESFENGLLEYPQYTEPYEYNSYQIPDILYSGNHTAINKWRKKESLKETLKYRPELLKKYKLSKQEEKLLLEIKNKEDNPTWVTNAIEKGQKFIKK